MAPFAPGQIITAAALNELAPVYAHRTSDKPLTVAVLAADSALVLPVAANTVYDVELHLIWQAISAADIQFDWQTPAGVSGFWTATGPLLTSSALFLGALAWSLSGQFEGTGSNLYSRFSGTLVTGGTAGNLQFRWAQFTANATATIVRANSRLRLQKML